MAGVDGHDGLTFGEVVAPFFRPCRYLGPQIIRIGNVGRSDGGGVVIHPSPARRHRPAADDPLAQEGRPTDDQPERARVIDGVEDEAETHIRTAEAVVDRTFFLVQLQ